jgi:periplasmic protein TonB
MFEDALVESTGKIHSSKSWTTTISFTLQTALLVAVIMLARFSPHVLSPSRVDISLPPPTLAPKPPPTQPAKLLRLKTSDSTNLISAPAPATLARKIQASSDEPVPATNLSAFTTLVGRTVSTPGSSTELSPSAAAAKPVATANRIRISSGSVQANCISCPPPLYPAAAKAVRVSGTVVLEALISSGGKVENLRVISGPPLLRNAAVDAARSWRYQATILNGQPVEVQAEINVVFHLN